MKIHVLPVFFDRAIFDVNMALHAWHVGPTCGASSSFVKEKVSVSPSSFIMRTCSVASWGQSLKKHFMA